MAVAVQPSPETKKPTQPMGLVAASLIGAAFVLAAACRRASRHPVGLGPVRSCRRSRVRRTRSSAPLY